MTNTEARSLGHGNVSRETRVRLEILVQELQRWQRIKNLVGPSTLADVWSRHIDDSLQLLALEPQARRWLDLGSGAGFPGLVLAIGLMDRDGGHVDLVESNGRKCAFLRHAIRVTGAQATVHERRIEDCIGGFVNGIDVVTARALAPLAQLLAWTRPLLKTGATGLFLKGQEIDAELTEASKSWTFEPELMASRTDPRGRIVRIQALDDKQRQRP